MITSAMQTTCAAVGQTFLSNVEAALRTVHEANPAPPTVEVITESVVTQLQDTLARPVVCPNRDLGPVMETITATNAHLADIKNSIEGLGRTNFAVTTLEQSSPGGAQIPDSGSVENRNQDGGRSSPEPSAEPSTGVAPPPSSPMIHQKDVTVKTKDLIAVADIVRRLYKVPKCERWPALRVRSTTGEWFSLKTLLSQGNIDGPTYTLNGRIAITRDKQATFSTWFSSNFPLMVAGKSGAGKQYSVVT
jgi:hypothetical protein